ncbi:hypothetical protein I5O09_10920 [Pseudomonas parafulva]|uniref:hypothetical protein n=1 Tax=Pseudomonas parafulva TaxID=157782 RepID=UPI0018D747F3|nr:hypothetical protein [Pseudomonas parafulva]MBH3344258.1 hypothetical protein [Pseudomonas parafulva]
MTHFQYSEISVNSRLLENNNMTPAITSMNIIMKTKNVAENKWDSSFSRNSFLSLAVSKPSSLALMRFGV